MSSVRVAHDFSVSPINLSCLPPPFLPRFFPQSISVQSRGGGGGGPGGTGESANALNPLGPNDEDSRSPLTDDQLLLLSKLEMENKSVPNG